MIKIVTGDCLDWLRRLKPDSIDCCVTSPPYFGLRDYGVDNQIGLEQTPTEYVAKLVEVFREVRRALKPTGTLWLNLGDSYANPGHYKGNPGDGRNSHAQQEKENNFNHSKAWPGAKNKDLIGIPWRVAFALQQDGWYLRQDIIWHKPNPMPESVRDRCTKAHEYLFLLSKSEKYYFDADAIAEEAVGAARVRKDRFGGNKHVGATTKHSDGSVFVNAQQRNRRSVWTVTTKPFKEAHFATFPPDLIRPCILAGSPQNGVVLDPFGGAGTTALVARELQRMAVLIELNPAYVDIANRRLFPDQYKKAAE